MTPRLKRALTWLFATVALGTCALGACTVVAIRHPSLVLGHPAHPTTASKVESAIDGALPLGSDRARVESWLGSQGMEFSYIPLNVGEHTRDSRIEESDADLASLGGYIPSILRDTDRSFACAGNVSALFLFDRQDHLAKRIVEYTGTCL